MNRQFSVGEGFSVAVPAIVCMLTLGAAPHPVAQEMPNAATASHASVQRPSIMGAWKLNHELSARPQIGQIPDAGAGGDRGGRSGGRGSGAGGMGGRPDGLGGRPGGFGGGGADQAQMRRARELMQEVMTAPESIAITQKLGQVTFTDADGHLRHYATDGKTEKHQLNAGVVETRTRWNAGELVIETSPTQGVTLVESYTVDPATRQLIVTLQSGNPGAQGSMRPVRRVYDNIGADR